MTTFTRILPLSDHLYTRTLPGSDHLHTRILPASDHLRVFPGAARELSQRVERRRSARGGAGPEAGRGRGPRRGSPRGGGGISEPRGRNRALGLVAAGAPQPQRVVVRRGHHHVVVDRVPRHRVHAPRVPRYHRDRLLAVDVPDVNLPR